MFFRCFASNGREAVYNFSTDAVGSGERSAITPEEQMASARMEVVIQSTWIDKRFRVVLMDISTATG